MFTRWAVTVMLKEVISWNSQALRVATCRDS